MNLPFNKVILLLILVIALPGIALSQSAPRARKVLVLYSYHDRLPWQAGIRKGLGERLAKVPPGTSLEVFEERMDAIRLGKPVDAGQFEQWLAAKYRDVAFDAIVTETQNAADFISARPALFKNVPRFLVNVTGAIETHDERVIRIEEDLDESLRTILRMLPATERILVSLSKRSAYTPLRKDSLTEAARALPRPVAIEFLDEMTFDEILERAGTLAPHSVLLYFPTLTDAKGNKAVPAAFVKQLVASAPVFVTYDTNLVSGAVGGFVVSATQVGNLIGQIGLGEALPETNAAIGRSVSRHLFDDSALKRWGIADAKLPPGSAILNREVSPWTTYRWYLLGGLLVLVLEALLILALLRSRRKVGQIAATLGQERERLEDRVIERTHDLEQANQRLRMSLRAGKLATWEWHVATNTNRMDEAWLGMLGYVHGDVPETYEGFRSLTHADDVAAMEAAVAAHLAGETEFYEVDFRLRAKDGGWRWIHAGGIAVERDAQGHVLHMAGIHLDITQQRQAEQAKQAFVSMVSHELRTPINAIIGMSLRALRTELNAQQHDYIDKIAKSSELLLRIINDILDFSKLEAGKLELEHSPFLLQDVLSRVIDISSVATEARGLKLSLEMAPDVPPALLGDGLRLEQVLINLASNAAKFTDAGEIVIAVKAGRREATAVELIFSVRDTGIGIDQADLAELFKPFSQLDGSLTRRHGGTGLGLSISRQLVGLMGGHIWAESMPGTLASLGSFGGASADGILTGTVAQLLDALHRDGLLDNDAAMRIDDRERYRKSTGNAIRRALSEIAALDPALAACLQPPTLRLGYQVVYGPMTDVRWTT